MNELVEIRNNQVIVSSRQVAEKFEREHKNVLRDIKEIITAQNSAVTFFEESNYQAGTGKHYPEYLMNRDGFTLLAMGFTGSKALEWKVKYIQAFNEMEAKLNEKSLVLPDFTNPAEAARAWATEYEKRKLAETTCEYQAQQIAEFQPIKEYVDTILASEDMLTASQIAADYGLSARALNKILYEAHLIHSVNGQWLLYSKQMNKGYTKSKTITVPREDGSTKVVLHTMWTQKGRLRIHEILTKRGIKANMDKETNDG